MIPKKLKEQIDEILASMEDTAPALPAVAPESVPALPQYAQSYTQWKPLSETEQAKALVDAHHERQGLKDLWPITGVDHYLLDGHDLYVVVCTRVSTIIFPDESVQHRCFVHCDLVVKRGGVLVVIAPCDDQESEGEL